MEEFIPNILFPSFICGIIFAAMGAVMYYYPPKEINSLYGYRTGSSMKSKERWDFAQRFSARQMVKCGLAMVVLSLPAFFIPLDAEVKQIIGIGLILLSCAYLLITTEQAIKKQFTD